MARTALLLFLFGATIGSALDAIHTHSGTTEYTRVIAFEMAWWTPLLFGSAGVSVGTTYPSVERVLGRTVAPMPTWSRALACFAAFVLLYFASGYLPAPSGVKLVVIASGAIALGWTSARTTIAFALAFVTGAIGSIVEIVLIAAGQFRYHHPDIWGIPIWLPALYASGSFAVGVLGKRLASPSRRLTSR